MSEGEVTEFVRVPNPLVPRLREIGVNFVSACFDGGRRTHVHWTTNRELADKAREEGARVTFCRAHDDRFSGWEISTPDEILEPVA